MEKCDIRPQSNHKIGFRTSKCKIRTEFESQIGFRMSNAIFEGPKRISIVKMRYSASIRMSEYDFKRRNAIFGANLKVKIGLRMSKCDIQPESECQNRISNVKVRYSARIRMSK